MPQKKSKENAINLLLQNEDPQAVAEQTGYSIRRIYDFKKELENTPEQPLPANATAATDIAPLQLQKPHARSANASVETKLEKALDTLLEHLEREVTTDTIEGIIKITEALDKLRSPTVNIAELIDEAPNPRGTPLHPEDDAREKPTSASPDAENFVAILERESGRTK